MENQPLKSMTTIQRKMSVTSIISNENKFRKVLFEQEDTQVQINPSFVYHVAMQGCTQVNQKILEIQEYGGDTMSFPKAPVLNKASIQEPKRLHAKITPIIQRVHSPSVNRSKSQHRSFNTKPRVFIGSRGKTMTVTRFSNKGVQRKTLISSQEDHKETKSIYKNTNMLENSRFNEKGQSGIRRSVQKKVRLKTNSVTSINSELTFGQRHQKCIPLNLPRPSDQQEESFWENAYRLRKCEVPVWYQISKIWSKTEQKRKSQKSKNVPPAKQTKKIIYEGYDFDGNLIPSTNQPQKGKKPLEQSSQINIQFFNEDCVENLSNYHERQQRHAKTYKEIKLNSFDCENEESEFLANLQRVSWGKNVQYIKREKKTQNDNDEKTKKSIKFDKQNPKITELQDQKEQNEKDRQSHDIIQAEVTKLSDKEDLLENFDKIRYGHSTVEVNENNNFPFGLSKYVKVKKFQQKQTKSKSYNYHTVNYFSFPFKDSQPQIATTLKLKSQSMKSDEKVRANKRLFKEVFNMSLKRIDPQNREDILTAKLIKDREKQNAEDFKNHRQDKNLRKHCARNSDTLLLRKGFSMKPTVFKKIKQIEDDKKGQTFDDFSKQNDPSSNALNFSKTNQTQQSSQGKTYESKTLHQGLKDSKVVRQNFRKSIGVPRQSLYSQNIEKIFKKQTKKTLIKQSAQDFRRQSFV